MNTKIQNKIFAIGDLHLPGGEEKPMDIFGAAWENHFEQITANWLEQVSPDDIVLIPGDISWAMNLYGATADLEQIGKLPGHKILIRGNHDYWWTSISKIRNILSEKMFALQNDAIKIHDCIFCGTRGWLLPHESSSAEDAKIYKREVARLEMSLERGKKIDPDARCIVLVHYPPTDAAGNDTEFTQMFEKYTVNDVIYGHLHANGIRQAFKGRKNGVDYHFVSCDGLGFKLYELPDKNDI